MPLASKTQKQLERQLRASPTALTPGASPTAKDVELSKQLRAAQATRETEYAKQKREEVYGKEKPTTGQEIKEEKKMGPLERALKALTIPVNIAAGVAETALGKGTERGLLENVVSNIDEGGTFGDVMRASGAPQVVAMPLGLAFDIALDPLNWVSAGQAAIVPRMFKGLTKGGIKGLGVATKSGALQKAEVLTRIPGAPTAVDFAESVFKRFKPSYTKMVFDGASDKPLTWAQRLARTTGVASIKASDEYDKIVGGGINELVRLGKDQETRVEKVLRVATKGLEDKIGKKKMEAIRAVWKYDEKKPFKALKEKEEAISKELEPEYFNPERASKGARRRIYEESKAVDTFDDVIESRDEGMGLAEGFRPSRAENSLDLNAKAAAVAVEGERDIAILRGQIEDFSKQVRNSPKAMDALNLMKDEDKSQFFSLFKTFGITDTPAGTSKFIDDYNKKVAEVLSKSKSVRNFFGGYNRIFNTIFKSGVLGLSVPARTYAFLSNISFTSLAGINTFTDDYIRTFTDISKAVFSRDRSALLALFSSDTWMQIFKNYPDLVRTTFGVNPYFLRYGVKYLDSFSDDLVKSLRESGELTGGNADEVLKEIVKNKDQFLEIMSKEEVEARIRGLARSLKGEEKGALRTFSSLQTAAADERTNFIGQEVMIGATAKWLKELKKKAEAGDKVAAAIRWYIEEPLDNYGKIDQVFKLTIASHLTRNGITEAEFRALNRWHKFTEADVTKSAVGNYYKLTPMAALEVANEAYLNYLALPAFAKIMRSLPLVGAPFFSFTYASGARLLRGLNMNPGYYNKISFFLHELSGEKDPLEKKALEGKYYSYLNEPNFVKLPFFQKNPIYLNVQQMFPHYSMQLLQQSERDYESQYGSEIAGIIDKTQILKTPEGQLLLNYIILPTLLGEAVNQLGQPIYPEDATAPEMIGRALTGAVDPFVPRTPSVAAAFPAAAIPEEAVPYLPGYSLRKMRYALQGRTASGVPAKEHPASRTIRAILSEFGAPVHRIDTTQQE